MFHQTLSSHAPTHHYLYKLTTYLFQQQYWHTSVRSVIHTEASTLSFQNMHRWSISIVKDILKGHRTSFRTSGKGTCRIPRFGVWYNEIYYPPGWFQQLSWKRGEGVPHTHLDNSFTEPSERTDDVLAAGPYLSTSKSPATCINFTSSSCEVWE